ncbi:hypothetical protein [Caulobacter sp. UNC279MFTsu5.1]|uniref:hypothetical protein n=1 Tax=Caulobacter sp. UNC279MFTsu5.1 TaxID=1502775 RepID=UPI0003730426|nr:hypothetical protein [Caulobacter sp. UNC279MFTsu5.1]SFK51706.1 hypothetical protein SAMN02799626_04499 [Caulobacter sp. UNC279MFTsu5.1]
MRYQAIGLLAGFATMVLAGGAAAASPPPEACKATEPSAPWQGWFEGGEYQRALAIDEIKRLRRSGSTIDDVRDASDCLSRYYGLRAGRQQTALDAGSGVVFFGALGSLASGGAGATTQAYWNYAALLPVVIAQFNASEPTRDLYAGGRAGLDALEGRYHYLEQLTDLLSDSTRQSATVWKPLASERACLELVVNADDTDGNVENWDAGQNKTALLADYRRLREACDDVARTYLSLHSATDAAERWKSKYGQAYARDLKRLDDEILSKDRQLRYSPTETLSAMAAAPFAAVATLLSGENGSQAIDRLKTQRTFATLNVPLELILLPPNPSTTVGAYSVSDTALARRSAWLAEQAAISAANPKGKKTTKKTVATPPSPKPAQDVDDAVKRMHAAARDLNNAHSDLSYALTLANAINALAAYNQLVFSYDATTTKTSVLLITAPSPATSVPTTPSPAAGR